MYRRRSPGARARPDRREAVFGARRPARHARHRHRGGHPRRRPRPGRRVPRRALHARRTSSSRPPATSTTRTICRAGRRACWRASTRPRRTPLRAPACSTASSAAAGLPREGDRAVHVCLGAPGLSRNDPLRFARGPARHDARRERVVAPLPGDPRAARHGLLGLQLRLALRRDGAGRHLPGHARREPRRVHASRARADRRAGRRGASATRSWSGRKREPQGPRAALDGADLGAHVAPRAQRAGRHRDPVARRASPPRSTRSSASTWPTWPTALLRARSASRPPASAPTRGSTTRRCARSRSPSRERRDPRSRWRARRARPARAWPSALEAAPDLELVARIAPEPRRRRPRRYGSLAEALEAARPDVRGRVHAPRRRARERGAPAWPRACRR